MRSSERAQELERFMELMHKTNKSRERLDAARDERWATRLTVEQDDSCGDPGGENESLDQNWESQEKVRRSSRRWESRGGT